MTALTFGQLAVAPPGTAWWASPLLNRIARHPALRAALIIAQTESAAQRVAQSPGLQAGQMVLGHSTARYIMAENDLIYGQATYDSALDVGFGEALRQRSNILSDLGAGSAYGIGIDPDEIYPALGDVLSIAAGRPIDVSQITPDQAIAILDDYQAQLDAETRPVVLGRTEGNISVAANAAATEIDCFEVPPGTDREEFERQLKEQQDAINNTDIDTLQARRAAFQRGEATRDRAAQREARRQWIADRTRQLRASGKSRAAAERQASQEAQSLDATHALDMVAGGLGSAISGLGNARINRSIGAQWRGRRVAQLDKALAEQKAQGRAKPQITLEAC